MTDFSPDWRLTYWEGVYGLEYRDPARFQWHVMYRAKTEDECCAAYATFQEGEQPVGNEVWP